MIKKVTSLVLITLILILALYGCVNNKETYNPIIINDGTFNIGMLIPDDDDSAEEFQEGFSFASNLANCVNINNEEIYNYYVISSYDADEVVTNAQQMIEQGVSVMVFCGEDINAFNSFIDYIKDTNVPVISLSPYTCDYSRFYSLVPNVEYKASCAATYAMEKGYNRGVVLCEGSDKYYNDFAEVFKNTFKTYIGTEPTVYYKNGEKANYSDSALVSGNYDYLLLIGPSTNRINTVNNLRNSGFNGEIMFDEVFDHTIPRFSSLNNCSFMTKLENDSANNISTVFYSEFSKDREIEKSFVTSAAAYGYDAYMTIFEALKSFSEVDTNSIFKNENTTSASATENVEITLSDFTEAIENIVYHGVTDTIKFKDNACITTYIYVDNISNSEITLSNKYTFSDK